jgi:hypothetical protein
MIRVHWPWQYSCSVISNLVAYTIFSALFLPVIILISTACEHEKNPPENYVTIRVIPAAVVISSMGLAWFRLYRRVGRRFLWYGLSSYSGQSITHRAWPKTAGEIVFAFCSILVNILAVAIGMLCVFLLAYFILVLFVMRGNTHPQQISETNNIILAMMLLCGLVTVFAMYMVTSLETGWWGVFPPDQQLHYVALDSEDPFD